MIAFAHTKFGLVRIKGSGVKRGGGICPPPIPSLSEFLKSRHGKFTLGSFSDRDEMSIIQCTVNCDALTPGVFFNIVFTSAP